MLLPALLLLLLTFLLGVGRRDRLLLCLPRLCLQFRVLFPSVRWGLKWFSVRFLGRGRLRLLSG